MAKIKTRETKKDIKVFDRTASAGRHMKDAFVKSKETMESADKQAGQTQDAGYDSPSEYASDQITGGAKDTVDRAAQKLKKNPVKRASENVDKAKRNMREAKRQMGNARNAAKNNQPKKQAVKRAQENMHRTATRTKQAADKTIKQTARGVDKTIKTTSRTIKGTAKSTRKTIKTADNTAKVAVKTSKQAAKATQRAAQAAAKAAKAAVQTAKAAAQAAAQAAKVAVKTTMAIIKAAIAAVKALIAVIAAGGWIAVVIILLICLIGLLLGSVFGVFFSNEAGGGSVTMSEVVAQLNHEFSGKIEQIQNDNPHDHLVLNNSGSSSLAANWRDVLAIYAVKTAGDEENGMEVATLDDGKIAILRDIFWDMNEISYSVTTTTTQPESITDDLETEDTGEEGEDAEPKTYTVLTITVASKGATQMSATYHFTDTQTAMLDELMLPEYQSLFMELTGSYANISLSPEDMAWLLENLPQNTDERRQAVVTAAYSIIGKVNYFWGGKSTTMGWDSRWGTPTKVSSAGSPTTGTIRPFGLDCSGYVTWAFCNAAGTADAVNVIRHGARNQYAASHKIEWNSAQPGDVALFKDCSHIGIVIGKKPNGNIIIAHCSSSRNNVVVDEYSGPKANGFCMIGRPRFYD